MDRYVALVLSVRGACRSAQENQQNNRRSHQFASLRFQPRVRISELPRGDCAAQRSASVVIADITRHEWSEPSSCQTASAEIGPLSFGGDVSRGRACRGDRARLALPHGSSSSLTQPRRGAWSLTSQQRLNPTRLWASRVSGPVSTHGSCLLLAVMFLRGVGLSDSSCAGCSYVCSGPSPPICALRTTRWRSPACDS